jgi:hypothetical protein
MRTKGLDRLTIGRVMGWTSLRILQRIYDQASPTDDFAALPLAALPGVVGLLLADRFSLLAYRGALPLVPFLLAGWPVSRAGVGCDRLSSELAGARTG